MLLTLLCVVFVFDASQCFTWKYAILALICIYHRNSPWYPAMSCLGRKGLKDDGRATVVIIFLEAGIDLITEVAQAKISGLFAWEFKPNRHEVCVEFSSVVSVSMCLAQPPWQTKDTCQQSDHLYARSSKGHSTTRFEKINDTAFYSIDRSTPMNSQIHPLRGYVHPKKLYLILLGCPSKLRKLCTLYCVGPKETPVYSR